MFGRTKITLWESNWIQAILCQVFGSQNDKPVHPNQPRWALAACGRTGRKPTDAASENVYAQIVIESSWALCLDSGTTIYDTSMNPLEQNTYTGTPHIEISYAIRPKLLKKNNFFKGALEAGFGTTHVLYSNVFEVPPTHFLPVSSTTFKHPFPLSYLHFFLWCLWVTHFYSYQYFRVIFPFFQGQSLLQMYSRLHCCSPAANLQETTLRYQISESLWHWLVMACEEERSR